MRVVLVPTTHWDREWYRTFQAFRARLVDTVDRVLELLDADPGYRFLLDGQTVVCEDYLEIRPERTDDLAREIGAGRVGIGPWYVQPDSLLPGGEAHVRNLLEGRRVGEAFGPVSRVGYTPDSFGHPAQFPQLFGGFGLGPFVYWRGNSNEIVDLPAEYAWEAPDGSRVVACHLWRGYFNAAGLHDDPSEALRHLKITVAALAERTRQDRILLLAGSDHQLPEARTKELTEALAEATGDEVVRGLLEDYADGLDPDGLPTFSGEMLGGRVAHLLPGVWSTRTWIKLRNRACETALGGWAEPWTALGHLLGTPDERPALRAAWRELLRNQAHDSICGCSQDAVHEQMKTRYDASWELANETTLRTLERIAGLGAERRTPWSDEQTIAVFNPSPHPRTDVVRFPLEGYPPFLPSDESNPQIHPLVMANLRPKGFEVDGSAARLVPAEGTGRVRLVPNQSDWEVEFVASDVPAFGYRTFTLSPSDEHPDTVDDGREISAGGVAVTAAADGTLTVRLADREYTGVGAIEDTGDCGDTYDHDPVPGDIEVRATEIERTRGPSGIQRLRVTRRLGIPTLTEDRSARSSEHLPCDVTVTARVAPGVDRVDLRADVDNDATDHRLRLRFPTGAPVERFRAATTFDVADRTTTKPDDAEWRHPAPDTFPHQGWVSANGLIVAAPGVPEAEVTPDGTIAITLLRSVGWLSRLDLGSRPGPAGPSLPTPNAQCAGFRTTAHLALFGDGDPWDAELGLRAVAAGDEPLVDPGTPLVSIEPRELVLSALKPAEEGDGFVLRVLNPTDDEQEATVELGIDVSEARAVRLDETPTNAPVTLDGRTLTFEVPPRALRSVRLR